MRKNILRIFLFFLISIVSFAANYRIEKLDIEANLQKDGSMVVSEAVTYDIDEINGVYFDIDAKGYGGITSLQVFEDEGHYEDNVISYREVDPVNYEVTENDGVYRIKLYSRNNNNTRTFKFVYTLPEAISEPLPVITIGMLFVLTELSFVASMTLCPINFMMSGLSFHS